MKGVRDMDDHDYKAKLKASLPYLRNVYTSIFATLTVLLFSNIIFDGYIRTYRDYEIDLLYPSKVILITLLPVTVIFTVYMVYNYFDNLDLFNKREYFESRSKRLLVLRTQYLVTFAIPLLFSTLLLSGAFRELFNFYFPTLKAVAVNAIANLLAVVTMTAMRFIQLWSLQDKWQAEMDNPLFIEKAMFKRNRDMYLFKPHQIILQPIGYFFAFGATCLFVSYLVFPYILFSSIITLINIVLTPDMWWVALGLPVIIIAAVLAFIILYNVRRRRILLRKLKQMQKEGLARVEMKGAKYLSATFIFLPFKVKITDRQGEVYNCTVVTTGEINAPLFFKKDEYIIEHGFHMRGGALIARGGSFAYAVDVSNLGGKDNPTNLILGFRTSHKLTMSKIESEHNVVILNPAPTTAFVTDGFTHRSVDTGEVVGDYTIYTSTGLFNHIERQSRKGQRDYEY